MKSLRLYYPCCVYLAAESIKLGDCHQEPAVGLQTVFHSTSWHLLTASLRESLRALFPILPRILRISLSSHLRKTLL